MSALHVLPTELWYQILNHVVTPTRPVQVGSWEHSRPSLEFAAEDADIQRSLTLLTGRTSIEFPFPVCIPNLWRTLISQSRWLLKRDALDIENLVCPAEPYARGREIPYARTFSQLQTTFTAQIEHVDIVIDSHDYFEDDSFIENMSHVLGGQSQWAQAQKDQITAVLDTCRGLRSLRVNLDAERGAMRKSWDLDCFYMSFPFQEVWAVTAPGYASKPVKDWKEECGKRGIEFRIVARLKREEGTEEEDLTEFWDVPEHVRRDKKLWSGGGFWWAMEANMARRLKRRLETEALDDECSVSAIGT